MITLFLLLLRPALLCVDGGSRNWKHVLAALIAWPLDILIAHTVWALIAGSPRNGEWTISDTLERLCMDTTDDDWAMYYALGRRINRISPSKRHIRNAAL